MGQHRGLIAGLMNSDYELIRRSLQDVIIEPVRAILIPGFREVKQAAIAAGALGCSISGSGPRCCPEFVEGDGEAVAKAMTSEMASLKIGGEVYVSKINRVGPRILE